MILAEATQDTSNLIDTLQLIAMCLIFVLGGWIAFARRGTNTKDESRDKDLKLLSKEVDLKIGKEKGSREKKEIELMNEIISQGKEQNNINSNLEKLITTVHKEHRQDKKDWSAERKDNQEKWGDFITQYIRWTDKTNDSIHSLNGQIVDIREKVKNVEDNSN